MQSTDRTVEAVITGEETVESDQVFLDTAALTQSTRRNFVEPVLDSSIGDEMESFYAPKDIDMLDGGELSDAPLSKQEENSSKRQAVSKRLPDSTILDLSNAPASKKSRVGDMNISGEYLSSFVGEAEWVPGPILQNTLAAQLALNAIDMVDAEGRTDLSQEDSTSNDQEMLKREPGARGLDPNRCSAYVGHRLGENSISDNYLSSFIGEDEWLPAPITQNNSTGQLVLCAIEAPNDETAIDFSPQYESPLPDLQRDSMAQGFHATNQGASSTKDHHRVYCTENNCKMYFPFKDSMMRHRRNVHGFKYNCARGHQNIEFDTREDYRCHCELEHRVYRHAIVPCNMEGCEQTFKSGGAMRRHVLRKHQANFKCMYSGCHSEFESENTREKHVYEAHGPQLSAFHCKSCGAVFVGVKGLRSHIAARHRSSGRKTRT